MAKLGISPFVRMLSITFGYVGWLVVVVSMRVAYDPLIAYDPLPAEFSTPLSPTPAWHSGKEATVVVTKNVTGCIASSLLFICEERTGGNQLWVPQESALVWPPQPATAEVVPSSLSTSGGSSDLMFLLLLPLLIMNGAFAFAGSRPKSRQPKQPPAAPAICKEARKMQFAYLHSAETVKEMRRSNTIKRHTPQARRVMAYRGALKGGF